MNVIVYYKVMVLLGFENQPGAPDHLILTVIWLILQLVVGSYLSVEKVGRVLDKGFDHGRARGDAALEVVESLRQ